MIIDTHAHLDFSQFGNEKGELNFGKIEEVINRAKEAGVEYIINIGCNYKCSLNSIETAQKFENVYAVIGVHPYDASEVNDELLEEFTGFVKDNSKIVAIGEIGLDYHEMTATKDEQKQAFIKQINLAREVNLPIIVHCRDAYGDTLTVLNEENPEKVVFHCYSGDLQYARELWSRGYLTSFTGVITYPKAGELLEVVKECPMDKFMVETDCPFLAPQIYRGQTNEPAFVTEVVRKIAEVKGMSFKEIERISTENAERFFGI